MLSFVARNCSPVGKTSVVFRAAQKKFFTTLIGDNSQFKVPPSNASSRQVEIIGELESDVLEVLKIKGHATAAEVMEVLKEKREIAYTTVSTTLDRLFKKRLVERKALPGPGGTRYLFSLGKDEKLKKQIVESTLDRITSAFGETAYSAIYRRLDSLSEDELDRLKKQVEKARRKK